MMKLMSLRYALLGLLAGEPASGYELASWFEHSLQRWAWHARHSQIYPELNKLEEEGLIYVAEEGARGRRTYKITESGRAEVHEWLVHPPPTPLARDESVLRVFLLGTLDADDCQELMRRYEQEARTAGAELDALVERQTREHDGLWFGRLAAEYGRFSYRAQLGWARWAQERLAEQESETAVDAGHSQ
jgi:DNA-binding PadR family transcriptional regulator